MKAMAHRILVVSGDTASYLRERGVNGDKIRIAKHWVDASLFEPAQSGRDVRRQLGLQDRFVVMFAGNLGLVQGLETAIQAAAYLRDTSVALVLVGDGADRTRLEAQVKDLGLSNVLFAGRHQASEMGDFFRAADALLVHLRPSTIARHAIPTKILAYLAAGKPIVCAMGGPAADLVRAAGAGVTVEPGEPRPMADAIRRLAALGSAERDALGASGRRYLRAEFDSQRVINEYEDILREVVDRLMRTRTDPYTEPR